MLYSVGDPVCAHEANEWVMMRREELDYMFHQSSVRALSSSIIHSLVQYTFMEALLCIKHGSSHGGKAALSETGTSPVELTCKWRD